MAVLFVEDERFFKMVQKRYRTVIVKVNY